MKNLLKTLSLEEKIGQLVQLTPAFFAENVGAEATGPLVELGLTTDNLNRNGSILGLSGAENAIKVQSDFLKNNDKKIPMLFMADVIHGFKTVFPVPLAMGCTWDENLVEKSAEIAAKEATVSGLHVTFSPMVDLVRDPRWGRVMESTGEDVYLNSLMARAQVRGYQGKSVDEKYRLAACVKHFAAYGAVEGGRDYNTVDISERILRDQYLPSYKAAIDEGAKMIMTSFNTVDSVPATANKWLMDDILRKEWGFDGTIITDYTAIMELLNHCVAEDLKEAAEKSINATVDIDMMSGAYAKHLKELVEEGRVSIETIDSCVLRILNLKKELGLFENPFKDANAEEEIEFVFCAEHRQAAREIAANSMVLLKNNGTLPFNRYNLNKVAIVGPFGENTKLNGPWSIFGSNADVVTLREGIENKFGKENVVCVPGCHVTGTSTALFEDAIKAITNADAVILALGEEDYMSGEAGCRTSIKLPGVQEELANKVLALGKPTVAVLFNGRPLDITDLYAKCPAILEAWYPGTESGNAIADILVGDFNPCAKLTMSFPVNVGQIPVYYNHFNTGRPKGGEGNNYRYCSHYLDAPNAPLLPFGFGLSYSNFEYSNVVLDKNTMNSNETITISVKIKNNSMVGGNEIVQLYIQDVAGSVVRPVKELKGFKKLYFKPLEEKIVTFEINEEMLRFYNQKCDFVSEKGKFIAMVGPNSSDISSLEFRLI